MGARVLGLRAEPSGFHWAVVEGRRPTPILHDHGHCEAPVNYTEAQALSWCRERVLQIVDDHKPSTVAIRFPEGNSRGNDASRRRRSRVEGVLLEGAAGRQLATQTAAFATIGKSLGMKAADAKQALAVDEFCGVKWDTICKERREAVLVAVSALVE